MPPTGAPDGVVRIATDGRMTLHLPGAVGTGYSVFEIDHGD